MIRTHNLTKWFDTFPAVQGVNLHVEPGQVLALLGPNGAGKTTTVRMLASILMPTEGEAWVAGYHTVRDARAVRQHVGLLTEAPGLYSRMYPMEYIEFFGDLYGLDRATTHQRARALLQRFDMAHIDRLRLGELSKGMRQKMALIRAVLHNPPVLLLDEPTSAMDPYSAKQVRDFIHSLRDERRAIIVCTHNLAEAEVLADRIAIIRRGKIVVEGRLEELRAKLLGAPLYELRLAQPLADLAPTLEAWGLQVVQADTTRITYQVENPERWNPQIINHVTELGGAIISLAELPRSLEDVYLQVVTQGEEEPEETEEQAA